MRLSESRWVWIAPALWLGVLAFSPGCAEPGTVGPPLPGLGDDPADSTPGQSQTPSGGSSNPGGSTTSGGGTANPDASDRCVQVGQPASASHRQMFEALNAYRSSKGLPALAYSKILERAADGHALDMYNRNFFDHTNPDGDGPGERAIDAGFCRATAVGENIAWNQRSVSEVQVAWQNSPGHNANMVSTSYQYVGMGYYFSANGPYYVQLFGDVSR